MISETHPKNDNSEFGKFFELLLLKPDDRSDYTTVSEYNFYNLEMTVTIGARLASRHIKRCLRGLWRWRSNGDTL